MHLMQLFFTITGLCGHFTPNLVVASSPENPGIMISTSPATIENQVQFIPQIEGIQNYSIVCTVTDQGSGAVWRTEWYIERPFIKSAFAHIGISTASGLVDYPTDLVNEVIISGPPLIQGTSINTANNFLIKNFTRSFHMARLQCGTLSTRRTFLLGIEVAPQVQNASAVFVEGSNISITVDVSGSKAGLSIFPPIKYTNWRYNGEEITTNVKDGIIVGEYSINFTDVSHERAGTYSLSVSNGIENSTGHFALEIDPDVKLNQPGSQSTYEAGKNVTLVAINSSSIDSAILEAIWFHLDQPDGYIDTSEHYNIDIPGELTIFNVQQSDNGKYSCIVYYSDRLLGLTYIDLIIVADADYSSGTQQTSLISYTRTVTTVTSDYEADHFSKTQQTSFISYSTVTTSDYKAPAIEVRLTLQIIIIVITIIVLAIISLVLLRVTMKKQQLKSKMNSFGGANTKPPANLPLGRSEVELVSYDIYLHNKRATW